MPAAIAATLTSAAGINSSQISSHDTAAKTSVEVPPTRQKRSSVANSVRRAPAGNSASTVPDPVGDHAASDATQDQRIEDA